MDEEKTLSMARKLQTSPCQRTESFEGIIGCQNKNNPLASLLGNQPLGTTYQLASCALDGASLVNHVLTLPSPDKSWFSGSQCGLGPKGGEHGKAGQGARKDFSTSMSSNQALCCFVLTPRSCKSWVLPEPILC